MRVLLVEDDEQLSRLTKEGLQREGFAVDVTASAQEGVQLAKENVYNFILLDIGLPDYDGFWAIKTLRQAGYTESIFIVSGKMGEEERVKAFEASADDYIVKPFFLRELVARMRRSLSRTVSGARSDARLLEVGPLRLDLARHQVVLGGNSIPLTPKEFGLLEYLMRHAGRVVTQTALAQGVWNLDFETGTNVVEVQINRLRKKIDRDGTPSLIQTVRGSGYLIENTDA